MGIGSRNAEANRTYHCGLMYCSVLRGFTGVLLSGSSIRSEENKTKANKKIRSSKPRYLKLYSRAEKGF